MTLEISKLSNGLTVVTDPMAGLGKRRPGRLGEHRQRAMNSPARWASPTCWSIWRSRAPPRAAPAQIAEEIEAVGGYLNAYTSREQTAFHARILKDDVALALDMIADILTNPTFEPAELERERQVVLQELGQARDTPDDIIFDHLQIGDLSGPAAGLADPGRGKDRQRFHTATCCAILHGARIIAPDGMTLISSGAVAHDEIVALAEEKFAGLNPAAPCRPRARALCRRRYPRGRGSGTGPCRLCLSRHFATRDPDFYVAQLYAMVLGGGMSSRLFQEVREKRGLCYSIYAFSNNFQDGGFTGHLCRHRRKRSRRNLRRDRRRDGSHDRQASPKPNARAPRRSSNPAC